MIRKKEAASDSWGKGQNTDPLTRAGERDLEARVSAHIARHVAVLVPIEDPEQGRTGRAVVEQGAIAVLSSPADEQGIPRPGPEWLGNWSPDPRIRNSGLWNVRNVGESPSPEFFAELAAYVAKADRWK
jgi:hypothetical protein